MTGPQGDIAEAFQKAKTLHRRGRAAEAEGLYRRVLSDDPQHAETLHQLGILYYQTGRHSLAVQCFNLAIARNPKDGLLHCNLGLSLHALGRLEDAEASFKRGLALQPDSPELHYNLGNTFLHQRRLEEAKAAYRQAASLKPDFYQAYGNLGLVLHRMGDFDHAITAYAWALAIKPDFAEGHYNLGNSLFNQDRFEEASASFRRTLAIWPDLAAAHNNLGNALLRQGRLIEADACYRKAVSLQPDFANAKANVLLTLGYRSDVTAEAVFEEHRRWGADCRVQASAPPRPRERAPGRRLRVGFVSGDFRGHSVAFFLEPLLRARDPAATEVVCYAEVDRPDPYTERLQGLSDRWLSTVGLSDEALAEAIRADEIDILIDLAGHTAHNRLLVFARKPAPIQATWLGYPNTTGLAAVDYRIVNSMTDPAGVDALATEALVRLEGGFLCYAPPGDAPEVAPPPSAAGAPVTFGSFNNPSKLSDRTVEAWAGLLARVSGSRLLLKGRQFADTQARRLCEARFAAHGIDPQRLELMGFIADAGSHLAAYERIDIALDPFPYNGTTTTCEALWMGVPVIALLGDRHAGRVGASLLTRLGLSELIAPDRDAYLEIAASLAADKARLADLRGTLRQRLAASSLCDAPAFARRFEAALRHMWERWSEGLPAAAFEV